MDNPGYLRSKPTAENLAQLYFMAGERRQPASRSKGNPYNSQERIFGGDVLKPGTPADDSAARGKRLFAPRTNSMSNLLNGYSEGENAPGKAQLQPTSLGPAGGLNKQFKEMQTKH